MAEAAGQASVAPSSKPDVMQTFQKGVAISVWQNSGDPDLSNWSQFVHSRKPFKNFGITRYRGKYNVDNTPDFWGRFREDIVNAHKLGMTAFRLSIEWARIEPRPGQIDMEAVGRYNDILSLMEEYNIEPMASLHHFVHPAWFEEVGAFEYEANIMHFVRWSEQAIKLFGRRIKLWGTFNEPTVATFLGYISGMHPPGKVMALFTAGKVLTNMLKAHCAAYHAIKALPGGQDLQVGLVHHHITYKPRGTGVLYTLSKFASEWMTFFWGYDMVHQWMMTGKLDWKVPVLGVVNSWQHPGGRPPNDWWGINYYSRIVLDWYLGPTTMEGEVMTDMYYPIYPEGLYAAIKQSGAYGIPIYITETGIADAADKNRAGWTDAYMAAMMRAIKDGYDVRGLYYWTLTDNFEWNFGYTMKFGLYAWDPEPRGRDRKLREGALVLARHFKMLPDDMAGVRVAASRLPKTVLATAAAPSSSARGTGQGVDGVEEPLLGASAAAAAAAAQLQDEELLVVPVPA